MPTPTDIVRDQTRVEQERLEREREAFAARYAAYASGSSNPVSFEQYLQLLQALQE